MRCSAMRFFPFRWASPNVWMLPSVRGCSMFLAMLWLFRVVQAVAAVGSLWRFGEGSHRLAWRAFLPFAMLGLAIWWRRLLGRQR